jgi:hypothetical protein
MPKTQDKLIFLNADSSSDLDFFEASWAVQDTAQQFRKKGSQ